MDNTGCQLAYQDEWISLYCGDWHHALNEAAPAYDLCLADPPYGQTSLTWDKWPTGWPAEIAPLVAPTGSLWCYGSLRMFMAHAVDFVGWKLAQDLIWRKQNGSNFHADRFRRVHEQVVQFYRGKWDHIYRDIQTTPDATARTVRRKGRPPHTGEIGEQVYTSYDGGPRLMQSVLDVRNCHSHAIHPTQKPTLLIEPILLYSCPPHGRIFVPFAGSGSELVVARELGRYAVGYEINPHYCERAVERLRSTPRSLFAE